MPAFIASQFPLLLKASWQGAVMIVLVLAVQLLFGSRLNPRWRYGLWLLVMVRLALPWTVISRASLFNFAGLRAVSASFTFRSGNTGLSERLRTSAHPRGNEHLWWKRLCHRRKFPGRQCMVRGSSLDGGWGLWDFPFFCSRFAGCFLGDSCGQRPLTDAAVLNLLEDCKEEMGVHVPVSVIESKEVGSPTLFGFVRPRLLLPAGDYQKLFAGRIAACFSARVKPYQATRHFDRLAHDAAAGIALVQSPGLDCQPPYAGGSRVGLRRAGAFPHIAGGTAALR